MSDASNEAKSPPGAKVPPVLVQLYKKLAPLSAENHKGLRVARGSYAFAREATSVHLTGSEFLAASGDYPIVFVMAGDAPIPIALLGLRKEQNLFVDGRGQWRQGSYVPAYFRRYPFLFPETQDPQKLAILIDEASPLVSTDKGAALYEGGKQAAALTQAIELGKQFHVDQARTRAALRALKDNGLFESRDLPVNVPGARRLVLKAFHIVDQKKFSNLSNDVFLDLRTTGALDLAYFHFASLGRLARLGGLFAERLRPAQRVAPPALAPTKVKQAGKLN